MQLRQITNLGNFTDRHAACFSYPYSPTTYPVSILCKIFSSIPNPRFPALSLAHYRTVLVCRMMWQPYKGLCLSCRVLSSLKHQLSPSVPISWGSPLPKKQRRNWRRSCLSSVAFRLHSTRVATFTLSLCPQLCHRGPARYANCI